MTHVRTFVLKPEDLGIEQHYFFIEKIPFREELGRMINLYEEEIGLPHKTCQCIPFFKTFDQDREFPEGLYDKICIKVYVILTF